MINTGQRPCDEAVILSGPCQDASQRYGAWVLVATVLGSGMEFIDGTVVNVALPALQRGLGASGAQVQWVIEAYALLLSALLLVGGALGDRYGLRKIYMIGVVVFAAASVWCGVAPSIGHLIAARASARGGWSDAGPQQPCAGERALSPAEQGTSDWHLVGLCVDDDWRWGRCWEDGWCSMARGVGYSLSMLRWPW